MNKLKDIWSDPANWWIDYLFGVFSGICLVGIVQVGLPWLVMNLIMKNITKYFGG